MGVGEGDVSSETLVSPATNKSSEPASFSESFFEGVGVTFLDGVGDLVGVGVLDEVGLFEGVGLSVGSGEGDGLGVGVGTLTCMETGSLLVSEHPDVYLRAFKRYGPLLFIILSSPILVTSVKEVVVRSETL